MGNNFTRCNICGIQEEHKYLAPAISSDESISLLPNNTGTSDEVAGGGHGTRVAGAVLYPKAVPLDGVYQLPCWIRNMRILDENNCLPQNVYPPKAIAIAVQKYNVENQIPTKIFNHSIGSRRSCEMKHMTPWAAEIDSQSYNHDVLFIQAAGNISTDVISAYWQAGYFLLFNQMDKQPVLAIEVDGGSHKSGSKQAERDAKKNSILDKCAIPLLRLRTDGSGEKEKIRNALKRE